MKIIDISNCSDEVIVYVNKLQNNYFELEKLNTEKDKKIKRLNNIINREIPEWIEKHYGILEPTYYFDWLKELKDSDKE